MKIHYNFSLLLKAILSPFNHPPHPPTYYLAIFLRGGGVNRKIYATVTLQNTIQLVPLGMGPLGSSWRTSRSWFRWMLSPQPWKKNTYYIETKYYQCINQQGLKENVVSSAPGWAQGGWAYLYVRVPLPPHKIFSWIFFSIANLKCVPQAKFKVDPTFM